MATVPELIFCANANTQFTEVALAHGFRYGVQLPGVVYHPIYFADQDWRDPNREAYMAALAEYRPHVATVLDWEREGQLAEVLDWAEEAAQHVQQVIVVPKVVGGVARLPRRVGGKPVVLGYSVPTRYAGTELPVWEFAGWPVHLLGGSPHRQIELWRYFSNIAEVVSADGNYVSRLATRWNRYWVPGNGRYGHRWQEALSDTRYVAKDAPYEAFRRSCANIMTVWQALAGGPEEVKE